MPRTVTATEAKNNFGELLKWTKNNKGGVYIKQYGEPAAVIVAVEEFEEMQEIAEKQRRRKVVDEIKRIRQEAWARLPEELKNADPLEMYLEAGMSEDAARELVEFDKQAAHNMP